MLLVTEPIGSVARAFSLRCVLEKPRLVVLYAPDCPYCQSLEYEVQHNAAFSTALSTTFTIAWVNIHNAPGREMMNGLEVKSVPFFIVMEQEKIMRQAKGFSTPAHLAMALGFTYSGQSAEAARNMMTCGNGLLESGEACDDGNMTEGDGCSSSCQVEPGFICIGEPSVCVAFSCGNGIIEAGESCDDANMNSGDGCSSNCEIEPGYACVDEPSVCFLIAVCGNGIIEPGESCDDNNPQDGDGCSAYCQVEAGYTCTGEPSQCALLCGNGSVEFGEECDDGNFTNGDGCTSTCQFEGNSLGVAINEDGTRPSPAAMLDIKSTTRGILIPRMTTTQRNGILNPPPGLMVFDLTTASFWFYNGSVWKEFMAE